MSSVEAVILSKVRPIILAGPAKITGWPTCLSASHRGTNLSRALIGHVRVRVLLEVGLYKEVADFLRLCILKF